MTRTDLARLSDIVAGSGLEWTAVTAEAVLSGSTASSIARTLSPAIAAVPSDAVLATGFIQINVNTTPNAGNTIALYHENNATDYAAIARAIAPSGISHDMVFAAKVHQSTGSKVYYEVTRAAGTVQYFMTVTGYWAPAA